MTPNNPIPKPTLSAFGDIPRWIAEWCCDRSDLQGYAVRAIRSPSGIGLLLNVTLHWEDREESFLFPTAEHLRIDETHAKQMLDRLADGEAQS